MCDNLYLSVSSSVCRNSRSLRVTRAITLPPPSNAVFQVSVSQNTHAHTHVSKNKMSKQVYPEIRTRAITQIKQNPQVTRAPGTEGQTGEAACPPRPAQDGRITALGTRAGHASHFTIICTDHWVYLAIKEVMTSFKLVFKVLVLMVAINVFYCWDDTHWWPHATVTSR